MKSLSVCVGLMMTIFNPPRFSIPSIDITNGSGETFHLRPARSGDVPVVTNLIRKAYSIWPSVGVDVSPAKQSEEKTRAHLVRLGFVLEDAQKKIVGTFSLDEATIDFQNDSIVGKYNYEPAEVTYRRTKPDQTEVSGKYLVFKKLAIDPDQGRSGLGLSLYKIAEQYALDNGYTGVALETVIEARWLYDWYIGMGFKEVGGYRYSPGKLETLLMVKELQP